MYDPNTGESNTHSDLSQAVPDLDLLLLLLAGRSRGYGFASFGEPEDARRALT